MKASAVLLFVAGCFNPHLSEGGFKCGPAGECPDGQHCYAGSCYVREPVTVATDAAPEVAPPPPRRKLEEICDIHDLGTPTRYDNCGTGLRCIDGDANVSICLATCVTSAGCPNGRTCEDRVSFPTGAVDRVCALSTTNCDPLAPLTSCGPGRKCFLEGTRTICEIASGANQGLSCHYSRECLPMYTCTTSETGPGKCARVCTARSVCGGTSTCMIQPGSTYGYCF